MLRQYLRLPYWLLATLSSVFLVRIPSFFEPFYYGDEMIYIVLGQGIKRGLTLYRDLHDNKPPLLYLLASISGNIFWFRVLLCFWMLITIVVFWRFSQLLFKDRKKGVIATLIFSFLTSIPLLEGGVANAEAFMLLPTITAFLLIWKNKSLKYTFAAGLLLSIASLFKTPSIFDVGVLIALWLFSFKLKKDTIKKIAVNTIVLLIGISIPIGATFLWYFGKGAFQEYLVAAFLQNFGYINTWRGTEAQEIPFLVKNGPLLIRGLMVLVGLCVLFLVRKKRSKLFLVACMWTLTSLFAVTLSERPYPHYFVQLIPSMSLLLTLLFTDETLEQVLVIFPISLIFFATVYFNFWQYSTSLYFGRFITLLTESRTDYFDTFGPTVNRNYELAHLIVETTKPSDKIFVWGDSASIYALANRLPPIKYVADYHINDFSSEEETAIAISQTKPKLIIFLPEKPPSKSVYNFTKKYYSQIKTVENATVWYNTNQ